MSTRLERAAKDAAARKISHTKHLEIVVAERNKEILGLQERLRETDSRIRQLEGELEACRAVTTLCCEHRKNKKGVCDKVWQTCPVNSCRELQRCLKHD